MPFLGLSKSDKLKLQYEVIPYKARLDLTRLIRYISKQDDMIFTMICQNKFINIANAVMHKPVYNLECDYLGEYQTAELAWHNGQIELIMRIPDTFELIEILADLIENKLLEESMVNIILKENGCSFSYKINKNDNVKIIIIPIDKIDSELKDSGIPNIRSLVNRMAILLDANDFSGVIHTSASIFETLAKYIIGNSSIENKSFGSFFDLYRKESKLPEPILDYILSIFKKRNTEPIAGHGSTLQPTIKKEEAIVIVEMTKAIVRIERNLAEQD